ncbi:hypothetical protein [Achromobacter ruhlandii]|uniref:hypothetical protein n=1 Tax=Achromobacter ruhlandii TaxID=72557 RepID=UPI001583915C|nr:hypothetical protein [Achromobacter ruhlandii]
MDLHFPNQVLHRQAILAAMAHRVTAAFGPVRGTETSIATPDWPDGRTFIESIIYRWHGTRRNRVIGELGRSA